MISISTEVEKVVQEMTRNRRIFTAHDVTKVLRHRINGENIRHSDVKNEIHKLYANDELGIYTRTQINLGSSASPFVYHLVHHNPNTDYDPNWVMTLINQTNTTFNPIDGSAISDDDDSSLLSLTTSCNATPIARCGSAPTPSQILPANSTVTDFVKVTKSLRDVAASRNDGFYTHTVTKEGRLTVPVKMIDMIDVFKKDKVYLRVDSVQKKGQNVQALVVTGDPANSIKTYTINSDGRLRISSKFLSKIGASSLYSLKSADGSVVIVAG